jgi:protein-tyrosine phosphatase
MSQGNEPMNMLPFEKSYWVIPGELLAGAYPSSVSEAERLEILEGLLAAGIKTVINLTESGEINHQGIELYDYAPQFGSEGIEVHRKPIRDVDIPTNEEMDEILDLIEESLTNNKPVYFHCWGGVGRTGTVLGCYLLKTRMATPDNVFAHITHLKRNTPMHHRPSPETDEQMDFVRDYLDYHDNNR